MARSEGAARRQWEQTLGGDCRAEGERLVFRWPASPLAIAVHLAAEAREGPRWIEVEGESTRDLPATPQPALGVRFIATREGEKA